MVAMRLRGGSTVGSASCQSVASSAHLGFHSLQQQSTRLRDAARLTFIGIAGQWKIPAGPAGVDQDIAEFRRIEASED